MKKLSKPMNKQVNVQLYGVDETLPNGYVKVHPQCATFAYWGTCYSY